MQQDTTIQYCKADCLLLWEMALKVDLDVSFNNMNDCKGIQEKAWEINCTEAYSTNHKIRLKSQRLSLVQSIY